MSKSGVNSAIKDLIEAGMIEISPKKNKAGAKVYRIIGPNKWTAPVLKSDVTDSELDTEHEDDNVGHIQPTGGPLKDQGRAEFSPGVGHIQPPGGLNLAHNKNKKKNPTKLQEDLRKVESSELSFNNGERTSGEDPRREILLVRKIPKSPQNDQKQASIASSGSPLDTQAPQPEDSTRPDVCNPKGWTFDEAAIDDFLDQFISENQN